MEWLEELELVASDVGLRKNGRALVICAVTLSKSAAGYNAHAALLKQLFHVEEVKFDFFGLHAVAGKKSDASLSAYPSLATDFGSKHACKFPGGHTSRTALYCQGFLLRHRIPCSPFERAYSKIRHPVPATPWFISNL